MPVPTKVTDADGPNSSMNFKPMPLADIYEALFQAWGHQHWWPGETPLEVAVGAILVQNTAWTHVEKAIRNLRDADALGLPAIHEAPLPQLQAWIRPAGTYRIKAQRLRAFTTLVMDHFDGRLENLLVLPVADLRKLLLTVHGIGPETADSIMLYAAGQPQFVVDAYTRRFMKRHRWLRGTESYDKIAEMCTQQLPREADLYNEFHALIVRLGKDHCRSQPQCDMCPLQSFLPKDGADLT